MKAVNQTFTHIINGTTQFVIPVFQRDYNWTDSQCDQLWKDIMAVSNGQANPHHFVGSIVYIATQDTSAGFTRWMLIDGQQRLTTLTLLLAALRDHIRETEWHGSDSDPTAEQIDAYFLKNIQEKGDRVQKLVLRRHDNDTLATIVNGGEPPASVSERIVENYEYFREQISLEDPSAIYRGIGRLVVVDVSLDRAIDDPQLIFESLNSTGMDLSQSDLIRNFILMRHDDEEQTRLYKTYWSKVESMFRGSEKVFDNFARDYVALKTKANKQERASDIYRAFQRFYPTLVAETGSHETALDDILCHARYYAAFTLRYEHEADLIEPLARLNQLAEVPGILIMKLFDIAARFGSITQTEMEQAVELIESYLFRRAVCGLQSRAYWQIFARITHRLTAEHAIEDLKVGFALQPDNYRFPTDTEFHSELQNRDLYGLRICRYMLEQLENYGAKERSDTSSYTIEHIMPQNEKLHPSWRTMLGDRWQDVQREWLHRLGNLTLTGYNSTYSDRPFDKKKSIAGGFDDSSVRLNKSIRKHNVWTERQIKQRGRLLAKRAVSVWPSLDVDESLVKEVRHRELKELARRYPVHKVEMTEIARSLFEPIRSAVNNLGPTVIEVGEKHSVGYHCPEFFLEVLPRKRRLDLLLALDYNEVDDGRDFVHDATLWKFFTHARYNGGVVVRLKDKAHIDEAVYIVRRAFEVASS